ncbi:MAG TPA: preprotein translocase subunit SecG [Phycisphaerales bacterium]|nr:preprotein translocase subunit SecG [Phycisphaerales bacterium]
MILTLAQIPHWMVSLLTVVFLMICLAMILIILIQRPQGGGLSGAFGAGGGSGQTAFGAKTGDVLTIVTIAIFLLFLGTAVGLNFAVRPPESAKSPATKATTPQQSETDSATRKELQKMGEDGRPGDGDDPQPAEDATGGTPSDETPTPTEPAPSPQEPPATGGG